MRNWRDRADFLEIFGAESAIGLDTSQRSLDVAKQHYGSERIDFFPVQEFAPAGTLDLAYCNGVFHHIPPEIEEPPFVWSGTPSGQVEYFRSGRTIPGIRELGT